MSTTVKQPRRRHIAVAVGARGERRAPLCHVGLRRPFVIAGRATVLCRNCERIAIRQQEQFAADHPLDCRCEWCEPCMAGELAERECA